MSNSNILLFIEDIKKAGITILNEESFTRKMVEDEDKERALSRILSSRYHNISFHTRPDIDSTPLVKAFKDFGFDGFVFRDFLRTLKTD
jgi:hypothetical protein